MGDRRGDALRADVAPLRDRSPRLYAFHAATLAYAGDIEGAAEIARHLAPGSCLAEVHRAVAQWRTGEAAAAADRLGEILASAAGPSWWVAWFRAEALFDAGRYAEAAEALRHFQASFPIGEGSSPLIHRGWAYPKSLFLLARSHEELGQRESARAEVEKLLALWKNADPDLPLLAKARALRARLASP